MNKAGVLILTVMLLSITAFGQKADNFGTDSINCRKNLSLYGQFMGQERYDDAIGPLRKVYEICPKYRESIYINGAYIYKKFMERSKDDKELKAKYVDSLFQVYDQWMEHFGRTPEVLEKKGVDIMVNRQSQAEDASILLKEAIDGNKEKSSASALMMYYQSIYVLYARTKDQKYLTRLIEEYAPVMAIVDHNIANNAAQKAYYDQAKGVIDKFFGQVASCDNIVTMLQGQMDAIPADDANRAAKSQAALDLMNKRNCTASDLYEKLAIEAYEREKTHEAAFNLGKRALGNGSNSTALKRFKEASTLCGDCEKQADYTLAIAQMSLKAGAYSTAFSYGKKLTGGKHKADAYTIMGQAVFYSAKHCGDKKVFRDCAYWLATDYFEKAEAAGSGRAKTWIGKCKDNYPSVEELHAHGLLDKSTYTITGGSDCWLKGQTTNVRK